MDPDIVSRLDRLVGVRRRSRFITAAVERALEDEYRWRLIEAAVGSIPDRGHDWDEDPANWVHRQRRADARRVG
jgi:hypothetical protein